MPPLELRPARTKPVREEREAFELRVVRALDVPAWFVDAQGRLCYRNQAWRDAAGDDAGPTSSVWPHGLDGDDLARWTELLRSACHDRTAIEVDLRGTTAAEQECCWHVHALPLHEQERFLGFVCICTPVSSESETPSGVPVSSSDAPADVSRQKLTTLGLLAGVVAHDFNNLLTGILGNVVLAQDEGKSEATLQGIERAARQASELCQQLLSFASEGRDEKVRIDPAALVAGMRGLLDLHKVPLQIDVHPNVGPVLGSPAQLRQVLMNLLLNAAESMDGMRDARIELSVDRVRVEPADGTDGENGRREHVRIRVCDHGPGLTEEQRSRMFDAFYTTKSNGHGLGLSVTQWIVRQHGGSIEARGNEGGGTVVDVLLPVASEESCDPIVLVVDDEAIVRDTLVLMLEPTPADVLAAAGGAEAIELLEREGDRIGLVLLDLTMPRLNGVETHARLRELAPELPIVLMSGYPLDEHNSPIPFDEIAGVLHKPFTARELWSLLDRELVTGSSG